MEENNLSNQPGNCRPCQALPLDSITGNSLIVKNFKMDDSTFPNLSIFDKINQR